MRDSNLEVVVEIYEFSLYLSDVGPCDIAMDWCGWKSVRGWKRIKYQELDQDYQDHGGADRRDDHDDDDENDKGDPGDFDGRGRL